MALSKITLASDLTVEYYPGTQTFGKRKGHEGIIWHTSEYRDFSRESALACLYDQAHGQIGSYNLHIYDGGVFLAVPYMEASGGINPFSAYWSPKPWLKDFLSPAAYGDPAAYALQVVFTGKTADIVAGKMPQNMWDSAAKIIKWFERSDWGKDNSVQMSHADFQTNRSDPGAGTVDKIIQVYNKMIAPVVPEPTPIKTYTEAELASAIEEAKQPLEKKIASLRGKISKKDAYIEGYPKG